MLDEDGYPTEETLEEIRNWKFKDLEEFKDLFDFIKPIWKYSDCEYWDEVDGLYDISTGGWSGNEEIIGAMQKNYIFWWTCWELSMRGGHFKFKLRKPRPIK